MCTKQLNSVCCWAVKGEQYWKDERRICSLLLRRAHAAGAGDSSAPQLTIEDMHAASEAKSFDYRVRTSLGTAQAPGSRRPSTSPDIGFL